MRPIPAHQHFLGEVAMNALLRYMTIAGCVLIFLFGYNLLELVGWRSLNGATSITKIHPSFYIFTITALLALASGGRQYWNLVAKPRFIFFFVAGIIMVVRAAEIVSSGVTGGELSAAFVTWVLPAMMLVCLQSIDGATFTQLGKVLRGFFVINSLMGILERVASIHIIPTLLVGTSDDRASALLAHPLNASQLTGLMLIHLVSARRGDAAIYTRIPEIVLHALAMFAFGGRSALVFTIAIILFSTLIARRKPGERNLTITQRALPPLVLGAGILLIFLPIPFIDATLDRFSNDGKSSATRDAAARMLGVLDSSEILFGVDSNRRTIIQAFFHSVNGIELCWISLTMTYGLLATLPMMIALPILLFRTAQQLDRSAFYMALQFIIVTAGSLSIGSKSLLISQTLVMMYALCQRRIVEPRMRGGERAVRTSGFAGS
jgi:hypothetical protein